MFANVGAFRVVSESDLHDPQKRFCQIKPYWHDLRHKYADRGFRDGEHPARGTVTNH
jgi:hypothetical protein